MKYNSMALCRILPKDHRWETLTSSGVAAIEQSTHTSHRYSYNQSLFCFVPMCKSLYSLSSKFQTQTFHNQRIITTVSNAIHRILQILRFHTSYQNALQFINFNRTPIAISIFKLQLYQYIERTDRLPQLTSITLLLLGVKYFWNTCLEILQIGFEIHNQGPTTLNLKIAERSLALEAIELESRDLLGIY